MQRVARAHVNADSLIEFNIMPLPFAGSLTHSLSQSISTNHCVESEWSYHSKVSLLQLEFADSLSRGLVKRVNWQQVLKLDNYYNFNFVCRHGSIAVSTINQRLQAPTVGDVVATGNTGKARQLGEKLV